ncbi:UNVERIFIED_CONTAM: ParA family protein [Methylobacteriaceae bacterium AG10]|nr:ParA family protein [Methylobacteriaceae bacterium AG10]
MKTVAVIGLKGGSSKSTAALHLAVSAEAAGLSVAVIDSDPQGSAHKWFERREAETPSIIREIDGDAFPRLQGIARKNGADLLLIDTAGKAETTALAACEIADLVLVPIRPTQFDLETLGTVKRTVRVAERLSQTWVMLAQVPTGSNARRMVEEGEAAIRAYGLQLAPVRIATRAAFAYAMSAGLTATEFEPTGKAADEASAVYQWVSGLLQFSEQATGELVDA